MPDASATFIPRHPVDLRLILGMVAQGRFDPMLRIEGGGAWRASRTPDGPVTLRLRVDACQGPGAG